MNTVKSNILISLFLTNEEYFMLVSAYIQHLQGLIIHRPKHSDHLAKNVCSSNVAYVKELRIPGCSTNPY